MTFSASVYRRHGGRHRLVVVKLTTAPFSQHSPETDVEDERLLCLREVCL